MAKLNSTIGISDRDYDGGESHSISTRQIDNGWVTDISTSNSNTGKYECSQTFSKDRPRISAPVLKGGMKAGNPMSVVKSMLKGY